MGVGVSKLDSSFCLIREEKGEDEKEKIGSNGSEILTSLVSCHSEGDVNVRVGITFGSGFDHDTGYLAMREDVVFLFGCFLEERFLLVFCFLCGGVLIGILGCFLFLVLFFVFDMIVELRKE